MDIVAAICLVVCVAFFMAPHWQLAHIDNARKCPDKLEPYITRSGVMHIPPTTQLPPYPKSVRLRPDQELCRQNLEKQYGVPIEVLKQAGLPPNGLPPLERQLWCMRHWYSQEPLPVKLHLDTLWEIERIIKENK